MFPKIFPDCLISYWTIKTLPIYLLHTQQGNNKTQTGDKIMNLPKPTKRNSVEICGQVWHLKTTTYRTADTMGNYTNKSIEATRYSDGQQVTGSNKDRLIAVIAERIEAGEYPVKLTDRQIYAAAVRKMVAAR